MFKSVPAMKRLYSSLHRLRYWMAYECEHVVFVYWKEIEAMSSPWMQLRMEYWLFDFVQYSNEYLR